MQRTLKPQQIAAFYHDGFVQQQVEHFKKIALSSIDENRVVVDIGGGCGYFASAINKELNIPVRVIDLDPISINYAQSIGVEAIKGDALNPPQKNDEGVVCFNLMLHHLVANSDAETLALQMKAISVWRGGNIKIFVNEYIYESYFLNLSGWLIYTITKNKLLSAICSGISKVVPSLKANTFGVGVRFRSNLEWKSFFEKAGFSVVRIQRGEKESISLACRLLLIKEIRRDSFFLL